MVWLRWVAPALMSLGLGAGASIASAKAPAHWHDIKCARYTSAWRQTLARFGTAGLGRPFLAAHDAFLASNCTRAADVCPRSAAELKLANIMVVLSMNAGTASTFPPFACR